MDIRFYLTSSGRSPIEEFLDKLSDAIKGEFFDAISWLTAGKSLEMPISRNLSNIHRGLHELRFRDSSGQIRFFYYIKKGEAIYMVHALRKKIEILLLKDSRRYKMPWKKFNANQLAKTLGINASEVREKQKLMEKIRTIRKNKKLSQKTLASKVGVSQSRIAQIESGIGSSKVTFDVLFNILNALGYDYKIVSRKAA